MQEYPTDQARQQLQRLLKINVAVSRFLRRLRDKLASQKRVLGGVDRGRKKQRRDYKKDQKAMGKAEIVSPARQFVATSDPCSVTGGHRREQQNRRNAAGAQRGESQLPFSGKSRWRGASRVRQIVGWDGPLAIPQA
jgi:hypothetical protein